MMVNLPCLMESCSNFLRPTCSYTECWLSFLTGSCPTERTPVSYSSCFYLILTDLPSPMEICWYSGRFFPCSDLLVLLLMQCFDHSIVIGLLSRTLPDFSFLWNPAEFWMNQFFVDWFYVMLQPLPAFSVVWCPLTSFSDHRPFHSLR